MDVAMTRFFVILCQALAPLILDHFLRLMHISVSNYIFYHRVYRGKNSTLLWCSLLLWNVAASSNGTFFPWLLARGRAPARGGREGMQIGKYSNRSAYRDKNITDDRQYIWVPMYVCFFSAYRDIVPSNGVCKRAPANSSWPIRMHTGQAEFCIPLDAYPLPANYFASPWFLFPSMRCSSLKQHNNEDLSVWILIQKIYHVIDILTRS